MKKNSIFFYSIVNQLSKWGLIILLVTLFTTLQPAPAAHAATITVNTLDDEYDDITPNAFCSLREAIQSANDNADFGGCTGTNPYGDDIITFSSTGTTLSRTGVEAPEGNNNAFGDLDINSNITISGDGAGITIIDGDDIDRVIHTHSSAMVNLNNLTIQNGQIGAIAGGDDGGSSGSYGGGIYHMSTGNIDLSHVYILNNEAGHRGGGLAYIGTTTLTNCRVSGNDSYWGGGLVSFDGGTATITDSTFSNNTAHDHGGGLNIYDGSITVNNSTFTDNHGPGNGAGMASRGTLTVNNSTITGNAGGAGDGIYLYDGGTATVSNSIVSDNGTDNCNVAVINGGNNLEYPGTTCGGFTIQADPLLNALADNGGATETHALGIGSPALDAGNNVTCESTDQRDTSRPANTTCDIGAFELQSNEIAEQDCSAAPFNLPNANVSATLNSGAPGCFSATKQSVFPGLSQTSGEFEIVWRLSTTNTPFNMDLRLCYTEAELTTSGVATESTIIAYRWNESTHAWVSQTTTVAVADNCVDVAGVTEFSAWTLAGDGNPPTAVSLQSITTTSQPTGWVVLLFGALLLTMGGLWLRRVKQ